ncbi:broad specificity phosphatase PhoE [Lachnospiraceae bacterium PF1-21]
MFCYGLYHFLESYGILEQEKSKEVIEVLAMNLYIVRHGETDWNKEKKVQGRMDIPLNEAGIQLAKETREALKDINFDYVFTSPLKRARQTAEIIAFPYTEQVKTDDRLIEMDFGEYEGWSVTEREENAEFMKFFTDPVGFVPSAGGESFQDILERIRNFTEEIFKEPVLQDKDVLIVSHGAAINALLTVIKENPLEKFWGEGVGGNCSVTKVSVWKGKPEIIYEKRALGKER